MDFWRPRRRCEAPPQRPQRISYPSRVHCAVATQRTLLHQPTAMPGRAGPSSRAAADVVSQTFA